MIQLDAQGYFVRNGKRVVPVGVNYWPASAGVELWQRWPADEVRRDLDVVAELGLNCVRFFVRWPDFEPQAGRYDETMLGRLREMLGWFGERGLLAHPSVIVGNMSGGEFWPAWRERRNVFADPFMRDRAAALAERVSREIAPFAEHVVAVDHGNELCCLPDSAAARPAEVRAWCAAVSDGIRRGAPGILIVSGNDQSQVIRDSGWRLGDQPGCDFYSMHGYPVPSWHAIEFDGMTDPLCQSLLPLYTKMARAFGPVMVQEFGTILTSGPRQQDAYLRAVLNGCWRSGANGFLWWCLRDINSGLHPYTRHAFESLLGLVDSKDRVKPGVEYYLEFAREVQNRPAPTPANVIGLYLPKHYYSRDNPVSTDNDPRHVSRGLAVANVMFEALGFQTQLVRGDQPLPAGLRCLFIAGAHLGADEAAALERWVQTGGRLLWHGPDPMNWACEYDRLVGAKAVDYRGIRQLEVCAFGRCWPCAQYPRAMRVEAEPVTAEVLARTSDGVPALLRNRLGAGIVVSALPDIDQTVAAICGDRAAREGWGAWYRGMLELSRV